MPNKIEKLPDGNYNVELETGEKFSGDPLEVTNKLAEAHVNTKKWGQEWKTKAEAASQPVTPPAVTTPVSPEDAQLQKYLLDQTAKSLGFPSGDEYKAALTKVQTVTEKVNNQLVAADFMAQCQDFPNSPEAIDKLSKKIDENGWDFSVPSMIAAHSVLIRENAADQTKGYKPLSAQEINETWAANMQHANRPVPPPMLRSNSPDANVTGGTDPWAMKLDDLRNAAMRQQLEGK